MRLVTCHMRSHSYGGRGDIPTLTPAEAGTRFSDPKGMQSSVNLIGHLYTDPVGVYPPEDSQQSQYSLSPTQGYFVHAPNSANHYATPPVARRTPRLGWRHGVLVSGVRRLNEVNARRARLVLGWVTVFGRVYRLGM